MMKIQRSKRYPIFLFLGLVFVFMSTAVVLADDDPPEHLMTFSVTIQNLVSGQPLSPPIVATHEGDFRMFRVGRDASTELELIARDGNQVPMYDLLADSRHVWDFVDVGVPLAPAGTTVSGFTDSVTFMIQGREGDKLSLASMLICTNDGFVGLDRVKLPTKGSSVFTLHGYDAGVEDNTEMSTDIVDACSALGPVILSGDPNGNLNGPVDTIPRGVISAHGGVLGIGDLGSVHQIPAGAVKVTVTRISRNGTEFSTPLEGVGEVPSVLTDASGEARFKLDDDEDDDDGEDDEDMDFGDDWFADSKDARVRHPSGRGGRHDRDELEYKLKVKRIVGVSGAHIHLGLPDMNGPVVADLFGPKMFSDPVEGDLSRGVLTVADLDGGPFQDDWAGFIEAMGLGELYVNVHTAEFPSGEIRGQIGVRKAKEHDEFNRPPAGEITSPDGDVNIAPGESVFFAGTADDPDGDPVTVLWDFGDGESSTDLSPGDHTYEDPGTYTVVFTATDDKGLSDPTPDTRTITVGEGANQPPEGIITSPVGNVTIAAGESVFFEGTADDPDGDPVTVLWDFGDGESSTDLSPGDHTYEDPGTYTITFTATDDQGLSDPTPDTRTITVEGANQPPEGVITSPAGDVTITEGESVSFAGMASDPDGDPVTVLWDFGDGMTSTQMSPGNHTYDNPGTYNVTFTATDDQGLSDPTPDTRTITVEAAPTAVTLTTLQATIFTPTCVRCHGGSEPEAGLDLSAGQSFGNLVNVAATTQNGTRVIPFDADNSVLVQFLDDGHRNRPASERLQIRSWIGAGAQNN
jgi:PKD repeat protein